MTTCIRLDQYCFYIDYDMIEEDYYQCHGIDWSCIGGFVTDEFDQILDTDDEFMQNESRLFEKYINELLRKEMIK